MSSSLVHGVKSSYKSPVVVMSLPVSGRLTNPLRDRAEYSIDALRHNTSASNAYEAMKVIHKTSLGMSPLETNTSQTILRDSLEKGSRVPCSFPTRDAARHMGTELHDLQVSFGVASSTTSLRELLHLKKNHGVKNPNEPGSTMPTIAFPLGADALRHLVHTVPAELWNGEHCYHALPILIQATRIDSNLPGQWQMCLVAKQPLTDASVEREPQEFAIKSVLGTPIGQPTLFQQSAIRESLAGGTRVNQVLHKLDVNLPLNPEFNRWINVDFARLERTLESLHHAHAPNAEVGHISLEAHNAMQRVSGAGSGTFPVILPIPVDFDAMYKQDLLSFEYLVFTELDEVMRLEAALRKPENGPAVSMEHFRLPMDKKLASEARYIIVNSSTLSTLLEAKKKLVQREKNLLRLDHLALHISPVRMDDWAVLERHAAYEQGLMPQTGGLLPGNRARFSVDVSILYEPLCAPKMMNSASASAVVYNMASPRNGV